jgi:ATP-dependent Zn protease
MARDDKDVRATAFHEAGHAVSHWLNAIPFEGVSIARKGDSFGRVMLRKLGRRPFKSWRGDSLTLRQRDRLERHVVVLLAGEIAESCYMRRHNHNGASYDFEMALGLCEGMIETPKECIAYLNWLYVRSRGQITTRENWLAVHAVATRLLSAKSITGRAAVTVMKKALGGAPRLETRPS